MVASTAMTDSEHSVIAATRGEIDRNAGYTIKANPYTPGTFVAVAWDKGWNRKDEMIRLGGSPPTGEC